MKKSLIAIIFILWTLIGVLSLLVILHPNVYATIEEYSYVTVQDVLEISEEDYLVVIWTPANHYEHITLPKKNVMFWEDGREDKLFLAQNESQEGNTFLGKLYNFLVNDKAYFLELGISVWVIEKHEG